jgi:hypothetical protein
MKITKKQLKEIIQEQATDYSPKYVDRRTTKKDTGWRPSSSFRKKLAWSTDGVLKNYPVLQKAFRNQTKKITIGSTTWTVLNTANLWSNSDAQVERLVVDALNRVPGIDAYWKKDVPQDPDGPTARQIAVSKLQYNPDVIFFDENDKLYVVEVKKTNSADFSSIPIASNVGYDWYILVAKDVGYIITGARYAAIASMRPEVLFDIPKSAKVKEHEVEELRGLSGAELESKLDSVTDRVMGVSSETLRSFIKKILKNRVVGDKSAKLSLPLSIAGHKIRADIKFEHVAKADTKKDYNVIDCPEINK